MTNKGTLSICGPVRDGQFTVWIVRGPKGGVVKEFFTRKEAREFIRARRKARAHRKELAHVS